ncbi:hypothetical protein [Janthinobacterium sp. PC23-8]|uniref:hypothetical protein n=1 Tax=Janthinobacterium sp. PC23-8 TaxID=2012679 RepID=UPI000B97C14A|nr:hypothetical protein [Janthinobacterium sp. PC23-8]OYO28744.1 hypothetical protein CD932_16440 [Janthinobacterium sp. PC23-8]
MTIFFVISGYMITSVILQRWGSLCNIDMRSFYVMPWLALFVAVSALIAMLVSRQVSEPANRVLRAWYSRRAGAAVALRTGG